ncbi:hypothetical protein K439DRAFT_508150 [Ramaria rubella]|nr:hypothetical protein K439DRAFT_508150 [Ramaria rubella]
MAISAAKKKKTHHGRTCPTYNPKKEKLYKHTTTATAHRPPFLAAATRRSASSIGLWCAVALTWGGTSGGGIMACTCSSRGLTGGKAMVSSGEAGREGACGCVAAAREESAADVTAWERVRWRSPCTRVVVVLAVLVVVVVVGRGRVATLVREEKEPWRLTRVRVWVRGKKWE